MIPYVTWKDFYSVGDPSIDAQHKQILDTINELYEAMQKSKDRAVLKPLLDRLLQYTLAHFQHEEQIMQEHEYPDFVQHTASHNRIRQKTRDLREHACLVTGHDLLPVPERLVGRPYPGLRQEILALPGAIGQ